MYLAVLLHQIIKFRSGFRAIKIIIVTNTQSEYNINTGTTEHSILRIRLK
jgi:hypothetical protein